MSVNRSTYKGVSMIYIAIGFIVLILGYSAYEAYWAFYDTLERFETVNRLLAENIIHIGRASDVLSETMVTLDKILAKNTKKVVKNTTVTMDKDDTTK